MESILLNSTKQAVRIYPRKIALVIPPIILIAILTSLSIFSSSKTPYFQTNLMQTSWTIGYALISLAFIALSFTALVSMCISIIKTKKISYSSILTSIKNSAHANFIALILITLAGSALTGLAFLVGSIFVNHSPEIAQLAYIITYFAGLAGGMIFLTFAPVNTVVHQLSAWKGIKLSIKIVEKNYLEILTLSVILFVIGTLFEMFLSPTVSEVAFSIIIVPILALILTDISLKTKIK